MVGWIGGGAYAMIMRFENPLQRGRGVGDVAIGDVAIGFALAVALPLALDPYTERVTDDRGSRAHLLRDSVSHFLRFVLAEFMRVRWG